MHIETITTMAAYALVGLGGIIGGFKGADWIIGLKYKTKDECEKCREIITTQRNTDNKILTRIDTKVDIIMENFDLKIKEKD